MNIAKRAIKIIREEGLEIFIKKAITYIFRTIFLPFLLPYALLKIKKIRNEKKLDYLVDFAFDDLLGLISPIQIKEEILELLRILNKIKPKVILEIGTASGGTLFLFTRVASEDATIISIDLPGGKFGGGYPAWKSHLYKAFKLPKQKMHLIRANSHSKETLEKLKNILGDRKIDFLFIDGDHTYKGVRKDFEMYSPLVRKGGIIAFHDIVDGPTKDVGGVPKFWREIKSTACKEIIKDRSQGGAGIGVLKI